MENSDFVTEEFRLKVQSYVFSVIEAAVKLVNLDSNGDATSKSPDCDLETCSEEERIKFFDAVRNNEYIKLMAAVERQEKRNETALHQNTQMKENNSDIKNKDTVDNTTPTCTSDHTADNEILTGEPIQTTGRSFEGSKHIQREHGCGIYDIAQQYADRRRFFRSLLDRIFKRNQIAATSDSMILAQKRQIGQVARNTVSQQMQETKIMQNKQSKSSVEQELQNICPLTTENTQTQKTRRTGIRRIFNNLTCCLRSHDNDN